MAKRGKTIGMPPEPAGEVEDVQRGVQIEQIDQGSNLGVGPFGIEIVAVNVHIVIDLENGIKVEQGF